MLCSVSLNEVHGRGAPIPIIIADTRPLGRGVTSGWHDSGTHGSYIRTPPPRLALRIGVTGQRRDNLATADTALLRAKVHEVLELVGHTAGRLLTDPAPVYGPGHPVLRVISPLGGTARDQSSERLSDVAWKSTTRK